MQSSTLRPGLLVRLSVKISGNVHYQTTMLEAPRLTESGAERARWETALEITDKKEHEAAKAARSAARSTVAKACVSAGDFGLLCPESMANGLTAAVDQARGIVDAFNAVARYTSVSIYVITGRIAPDDAEAVRSINSEVRSLLEQMEQGVRNLDATAIRKAANAARNLGAMLSSSAVERVSTAIQAARGAARQIAKSGEQAAAMVDQAAIRKIAEQRLAFLDLDEAREVAKPDAAGRAVDFDPGEDCAVVTRKLSAALVDIEPPADEGMKADYPPDVAKALFGPPDFSGVNDLPVDEAAIAANEAVAKLVGRALEAAYPWGYSSEESAA